MLVGLEIIASHFSRGRQEKYRSGFTWCDCDTPVVVRCSGSITCGDAILHHIFLEVISPTRDMWTERLKISFSFKPFKLRFANCLIVTGSGRTQLQYKTPQVELVMT